MIVRRPQIHYLGEISSDKLGICRTASASVFTLLGLLSRRSPDSGWFFPDFPDFFAYHEIRYQSNNDIIGQLDEI